MSKMEYPICGKKYDELDMTIGKTENPICKNCFQNDENERDKELSSKE